MPATTDPATDSPWTAAPAPAAPARDSPETAAPVTVRYFAAAKAALGVADEHVDATEVVDVAALVARAPASARPVLERCSFLVDGVTTTDLETPLRPGILVDVLPPFAGG